MASKLLWVFAVLTPLAAFTAAIAQQPAPNYQPPPSYQQPPPNYQQPPPQAPPNASQPPAAQWQTLVWQQRPELKYHALRAQLEGGYTITVDPTQQALDNGGHVGLGLTWFPSSSLPLGLRVDGSYSRFDETGQSVNAAAQATGLNILWGHQDVYGGDADAELDLHMGPSVKEYFVAGYSYYREQTTFRQLTTQTGEVCFYFGCQQAEFGYISTAERTTSPWLHGWNAGLGFEFALSDPLSFFVEGRYVRIGPVNDRENFVPITVGLRF